MHGARIRHVLEDVGQIELHEGWGGTEFDLLGFWNVSIALRCQAVYSEKPWIQRVF